MKRMDIKAKFNELSVLAPILVIYTCAYLALMGYDFAAKSEFEMPAELMAVYIALVLAYAADKEIRRWTGKEAPPRKGTLFVYFWMIFYLVVFIINCLKPDYALPKDLTYVTLQVLGIFFGSKISKSIFQSKAQKLVDAVLDKGDIVPTPSTPAKVEEKREAEPQIETSKIDKPVTETIKATSKEEEIILDVIRKKGQAKREDLLTATGMSKSSLGRLLDEMEARRLIVQVGERKASYYTLPKGGTE
jgi:predicted transcriptional regulator